MTAPESSSGADELVVSVTKYQLHGRRLVHPNPHVSVYSRSRGEYKDATVQTYHKIGDLDLLGIEYVDGTGVKDLTVEELQSEIGKSVRIMFNEGDITE